MHFKIKIEPEAKQDIQKAIKWYNKQEKGLGKKFHKKVVEYIDSLSKTPYFENKYNDVHCLPIKKYPFMIHYTINKKSKVVTVRAVFHTSLNPKNWEKR